MRTIEENIVIVASTFGGITLGLYFDHLLLAIAGGVIGFIFGYMAIKTTSKKSPKQPPYNDFEIRKTLDRYGRIIERNSRELNKIKQRETA